MDRELVVRAQHGDEQAFESLTVVAYPRLFRVAHASRFHLRHLAGWTQRSGVVGPDDEIGLHVLFPHCRRLRPFKGIGAWKLRDPASFPWPPA